MIDVKKYQAEVRLRKLVVDLKKAYSKAARHIASALAPIEVAVADIGETWKPAHYAENLRNHGPSDATRPPSCFAHETFVNGDEADYVLCVGRASDLKCGLYVSICKYHVRQATTPDNGEKQTEVTVKSTLLAQPTALPVPLRLKILDVLDDFAVAYEEYVRETRRPILGEWADDMESDIIASKTSESDDEGVPADTLTERPQNESESASEKTTKRCAKAPDPLDLNLSLESWIPSKR